MLSAMYVVLLACTMHVINASTVLAVDAVG